MQFPVNALARGAVGVIGFALILLPGFVNAATDEPIIFTTAPTQSVEQTEKLYGPLGDYLSKATGKEVKLVPARNFLEYTSKMRKGEYDIIFDGPHFVGWRMKKLGDTPVARLPGELVFVAIVKDGGPITDMKQLIGKKVCAVNSPNLATLSVLDQFDNPVRQPVLVSSPSFKDAVSCLQTGKGVAAIIPTKFWGKWSKKGKTKGLRVLYSTGKQPLPPRTFTVSKRVDAATRDKIAEALVNSEGKDGPKPVLERFRSKSFVTARNREYKGLEKLLRSVWGFHE
ncbi:MAG: PhnD/SsuA/transferrin family substrate-binding protein [Granulosicoccaceae bacterium]|jgi:ABC-type phosphate/phosphonate transport system substrate-binding protein